VWPRPPLPDECPSYRRMRPVMATPVPEVIQSLPPVTIRHVMEGPDPWTAFFGTVAVALAAVIIALITLRQVYRQIAIANEQIALANQQIELADEQIAIAQEELAAVKADFDLAQKQFKEVTRRPRVTISAYLGKPVANDFSWFEAHLSVANDGDKVANAIMLEILVETQYVLNTMLGVGFTRTTTLLNGIEHAVWDFRVKEPLYPNGVFVEVAFPGIGLTIATCPILFRAYDENFAYPPDRYGTIEFHKSGPTLTVTNSTGDHPL
jgi:hypothetical protein